jgi:hypothetical protein
MGVTEEVLLLWKRPYALSKTGSREMDDMSFMNAMRKI